MRRLRIYIAAVPGEMDRELAFIHGQVVRLLRLRAQGMGIDIEVVDPLEATEEWDLGRRFQEIESCEIFVGLLGERYGEPPSAVPEALMAAQPWLAEDPRRSVLELEIEQALRHARTATATLFYLRHPRFAPQATGEERSRLLPESEMAAARLANLKDRIRSSGYLVIDGYSWDDDELRLTRLWRGTFDERVSADLKMAIADLMAAGPEEVLKTGLSVESEPPAPHPPPDRPLPLHENVQFTVYRPRAVEPMKWSLLLAFAHLAELPDALVDEPDPAEEVRKQAQTILGDHGKAYADVKQDSRYAIPDEAEITFLPEIPGFDVNPPRRTFLWLESVHREEFRIRAPAPLLGTAVRGRLSVFAGSILLAEIGLAIRVEAGIGGAANASRSAPIASRPFRNIFPSYSHRDWRIVEEFERYARTLGDRYLRDVHKLRAGEVWTDRLKDFIRAADVFQLFWSHNAIRSPYVEEEWQYALSLARPYFVRPTYWEVPLPEEPARGVPPEELRRLHFQLLPGYAAQRETDWRAPIEASGPPVVGTQPRASREWMPRTWDKVRRADVVPTSVETYDGPPKYGPPVACAPSPRVASFRGAWSCLTVAIVLTLLGLAALLSF